MARISIRHIAFAVLFSILPRFLHSQQPAIRQIVQQISASRINSTIEWLQTPGGQQSRVVFTPGFDSAAAYVFSMFSKIPGMTTVEYDTFYIPHAQPPFHLKPLVNVVATLQGTEKSNVAYVVGAHLDCSGALMGTDVWSSGWQTIRAPGADDNASGVAGILEIARAMGETGFTPNRTIKFVAFGAEESGPTYYPPFGWMSGARHFVAERAAHGPAILGMINLDMIGFNRTSLFCDIEANEISQQLGVEVVDANSRYGIGLTTSQPPFSSGGASDHAQFWEGGIPAILLIEKYLPYPENTYYHRSSDSLIYLNSDLIKRITQVAAATIAEVSTRSAVTNAREQVVPVVDILEAYPNPFNPSINICVRLDVPGLLRVSIVDMLGRELDCLVNEVRETGLHRVNWEASGRPSGTYLVVVNQAGNVVTRKIMFIQ